MAPITSVEVAQVVLKHVASQALQRLKANTCMTRLVNRDYEAILASAGDTVNVAIPPNFNVMDLTDGNSVVAQNPTIDKTQVVLNNHKYVSFQVTDIAELFTPIDVKNTSLGQAVANLAEAIDQSVIQAAYAGFTANAPTGAYNTSLTEATILQTRQRLVQAKAPKMAKKLMVVNPSAYTDLLSLPKFTEFQTRGPQQSSGGSSAFGMEGNAGGQSLAVGGLGTLHGFEIYENQMVPVTNTNETHNIAFTPDAILFVQRMLPVAPAGMGVVQTFVQEDDMALRVTMNYNADILGAQITIDTLYGIGIGRNEFGVEVRS